MHSIDPHLSAGIISMRDYDVLVTARNGIHESIASREIVMSHGEPKNITGSIALDIARSSDITYINIKELHRSKERN